MNMRDAADMMDRMLGPQKEDYKNYCHLCDDYHDPDDMHDEEIHMCKEWRDRIAGLDQLEMDHKTLQTAWNALKDENRTLKAILAGIANQINGMV